MLLKLFKPKPLAIQLPIEPEEPLDAAAPDVPSTPAKPTSMTPRPSSMSFDLALARFSLIIDIAAYVCMPLAPNGGFFTLVAMLGSLGSGFGPAVQSIALELFGRRGGAEAGRLFGALSVLSGIGASVIGPALFGAVFLHTVSWFPQAIFFTTAGTATISFVLLAFVRLPKDEDEEGGEEGVLLGAEEDHLDGAGRPHVDREETLVDPAVADGVAAPGGKATVLVQE